MKINFVKAALLFSFLFIMQQKSFSQTGCLSGNCNNGVGTWRWDSGDEYTGEWLNGLRTGLGVYDWDNGSYYYGYFQNGVLEGHGMYFAADPKDDKFGYFHNGDLSESGSFATTGCLLGNCDNGQGVYLWDTDDMYLGQWINGHRTGYGRYDWKDGSFYTGYFKNDLLDGRGYYSPKTGDAMDGIFENNQYKGAATNDNKSNDTTVYGVFDKLSEQDKANDELEKNYQPQDADLCTVLQQVVNNYPGGYEKLKGPIEHGMFGDQWLCNIRVSGGQQGKVQDDLFSDKNSWTQVLYESASFNDAKGQYDALVRSFGHCAIGCCVLAQDTTNYTGTSYTSYTTYWLNFMVRDGYSDDDYGDMDIELELSSEIVGDGWQVSATVMQVPK